MDGVEKYSQHLQQRLKTCSGTTVHKEDHSMNLNNGRVGKVLILPFVFLKEGIYVNAF